MLYENKKNKVNCNIIKPQENVSISVPLFKSIQRKYFVGQTEALVVGNGLTSWAGLINPCNSDVDLYVNVFTITNFSEDYLTARIWLNTNVNENGIISKKVSSTNTSITPYPKNKVNIKFVESTIIGPTNGVNVYERIVPPKTTLVAEEDGKFIEAPGGNYVVALESSSSKLDKVIVVFGWWEKPI